MVIKKDTSIWTKLSNKYNLPYQVIEVICNHPFKFTNSVITNNDNNKSVMFGYLFKIKKKKKYDTKSES